MRRYTGFHCLTQGLQNGRPYLCRRGCRAQVDGNLIRIDFDDVDATNGNLDFNGQPQVVIEGPYGYGQEANPTGRYWLVRHDFDDQIFLTGTWHDPRARGEPKYGTWIFILTPEAS